MSSELRCTGTPISWLRLEQHHAGELSAAERESITSHLASCEACAACFAEIESDALVPLSALPAAPPAPRSAPPAQVLVLRRLAPVVAALAVAACILLLLGRRPPPNSTVEPSSARTKGGEVGFVLVRDDDSMVAEAGGVYRDGDRWKALVTCPPGMRESWDLLVVENGRTTPALVPAEITCGNDVPLPGAFRTTGHERMTVCLVWNEGATCKVLEPAP